MAKPGMIITGGTGFLGARLTEICSEKYIVYSISRRANQKPALPPPYFRSKRAGEELLRQYRDRVSSCILRLAVIFSEWCEYEPLYNFLETWLGGGWDARILGGRGDWAVPYLHVSDLVGFFITLIDRCDETVPQQILQASPNGCTTMRELYEQVTRHHFGAPRRWIYVPKPLARLGIRLREGVGRLTGMMPFERSWMGEYIDLKLNVDATYTHQRLGWRPSPELSILNCIPTMIYYRKTHFDEWRRRYERSRKGGHRNPKLVPK